MAWQEITIHELQQYDTDILNEMVEDDSISPEEAWFIAGYLSA